MTSPLLILGAIASGVLLWSTQEWFRKEYLRRRNPTRLDGKWHPFGVGDDRAVLANALTHRDADPGMERIRRVAFTLIVVAVVLFFVFAFLMMNRPIT